MSLTAQDYASIARAREISCDPSPLCPTCGHSLGWHAWQVIGAGGAFVQDGPPWILRGTCQYVREQEGSKATTYRPCSCRREEALP